MPNKNTFSILPIKELIQHYINKEKIWIDPFANQSIFNSYCHFTNDLNLEFPTTHHLDALDFLKSFKTQTIDGILFDPPYSVRQLSECYKGLGIAVTQETTRPNFWTDIKNEITRIIKPNGSIKVLTLPTNYATLPVTPSSFITNFIPVANPAAIGFLATIPGAFPNGILPVYLGASVLLPLL